jgi:hypothetical protein
MFNFIIIFCYILVAYGACNVIVFSDGPFYIFSRLRNWANNINTHFGKMFSCMMCLPANFGWICSLFNWFFISIPFTPFNIIFGNNPKLWFLSCLCDGAFTTAVVYLLYVINDYIEKKTEYYESNTYRYEQNVVGFDKLYEDNKDLIVEDITLKNE